MRDNEEKSVGARVVWSRVWLETFGALDAKTMKAGAVIGVVVPMRVAHRSDVRHGYVGTRLERRGL